MQKLFFVVPSLMKTGPIKGALALCHSLVESYEVTLVAVKSTPEPEVVDSRIRVIDLGGIKGWRKKLHAYQKVLIGAQEGVKVVSFSMCLSADLFNYFSRKHAITCSSIRGHLLRTYRIEYGPVGVLVAWIQYKIVSQLDYVICMTKHMADTFEKVTKKRPEIIGNFIDEAKVDGFRQASEIESKVLRFAFVGRLCELKRPDLVIDALHQLIEEGVECTLDIYGEGGLKAELREMSEGLGILNAVKFHGQVDEPWKYASDAHCLVLPSLTEGISRAAMEALYLGVPCVLREVDSNSELVSAGVNGELFKEDKALKGAMLKASKLGKNLCGRRPILLGETFREHPCVSKYVQLFQNLPKPVNL